jgi:hypothetical protein
MSPRTPSGGGGADVINALSLLSSPSSSTSIRWCFLATPRSMPSGPKRFGVEHICHRQEWRDASHLLRLLAADVGCLRPPLFVSGMRSRLHLRLHGRQREALVELELLNAKRVAQRPRRNCSYRSTMPLCLLRQTAVP